MENNNFISLQGKVDGDVEFSHRVLDEDFYKFMLNVSRLSGVVDSLPVTVPERLLENVQLNDGDAIALTGQLRSYNKYQENRTRLILTAFAKSIETIDDENENPNNVMLNGYVCKIPTYRKTPFGREITDVIIAVNRAFNRSDYIPTICWGKNAVLCRDLPVGANVLIKGRLQSREYTKKLGEDFEIRTAYEVSVGEIEEIS
ncbi:MAG: single-stranded DNA-binding protein [Clostridia bacterium]|nr:single-stranded DNA-binding protein [Clostridia bacterium]